jgi:hypothetical protein
MLDNSKVVQMYYGTETHGMQEQDIPPSCPSDINTEDPSTSLHAEAKRKIHASAGDQNPIVQPASHSTCPQLHHFMGVCCQFHTPAISL